LIKRHVLPRWANLTAKEIGRADVKRLVGRISADRPILANSVRAAISAVFTFGVKEEVLSINPCKGVDDNPTTDRDRVLSDAEVVQFWNACEHDVDPVRSAALRTILLTGQRPGEISHMRREHIKGQWWEMPGRPVPELKWPGTKNGGSHRVFLTDNVLELIGEDNNAGFVFASSRGNAVNGLDIAMRQISRLCAFATAATPHDLRRTMGSTITARGHRREAMDRILNHRKKSVTDVYDRHDYAKADQKIMEDISAHLMRLIEGAPDDNVIAAQFRRGK